MPYSLDLKHRPGKNDANPADYISRHPCVANGTTNHVEDYVNYVARNAIPNALTISEIHSAIVKDSTYQALIHAIGSGNWSSPLVSSFQKVKDELAITDDFVLRDTRLVLPESLHQQAIDLAHAGHQGIVRTKRLLREKVWFPKIDKLAADTVKKCLACQACIASTQRPEPIESGVLPSEPWNEVSVDFLSGLPNNDYLLVVMDDYSRFPEVEIVGSTSAKTVIPKLDSIFARHGIPVVVKSDTGPPFNSDDFRNFASSGIHSP